MDFGPDQLASQSNPIHFHRDFTHFSTFTVKYMIQSDESEKLSKMCSHTHIQEMKSSVENAKNAESRHSLKERKSNVNSMSRD